MDKNQKSKVVVDTAVDEDTPTVVVSNPPAPKQDEVKKQPNFVQKATKKAGNFVSDFLETIVVALSIFVVVYLFLIQPHEVKGSSMEPNFHNNEYILTDKISYRFKKPQRGDVVIFKAPTNPDVDYIKRVIGLPGESVKIELGQVFVDDEKLNEAYLEDRTTLFPGSTMREGENIYINEGEYFVLGDNRPHSSDSREFGPIPEDLIIGKAVVRYWPLPELGPITSIDY